MRKTPDFRERLQQGVILCDGAMGTYLHSQGVPMDRSFPEQTLVAPDLVERVHREYAEAGAEILKTNTYGAQRLQLERFGLGAEVRRINVHGARLARQASEGRCYVAGSVGPLGRSLAPLGTISPEAAAEVFREQIEALVEGGVDLIMIETISDLAEFNVALAAARAVSSLPIVVHKTFTEDGRTLMGELPHEVARSAAEGGADVVGANCTVGPQRMLDIIERMAQRSPLPLSALPTAGLPRLVDGRIDYHAEPEYMAGYARRMAEAGATIVGACCGSTPEHVAAMSRALSRAPIRVRRSRIEVEVPAETAVEPCPVAERSALAAQLGRRFLVAADAELPRGHDLNATLRHGAQLQRAGVDALVLSDALRARLYVHPMVVAYRIQSELAMECVPVYAARDKNVLGIQADFLASHVLGVRNLLVSVADPANYGDYPTATTLNDVGGAGLVKILDLMNRGLDLARNPIGDATSFVALVSGNPAAPDLDAEVERLRAQVDAGAVAIVTEPMFSLQDVQTFCAAVAELRVPVVAGLLPLRSAEHAEYLHNEVPGMRLPDDLVARLRAARDPSAEGLAAARELLQALPAVVAGVHLVPPYRKAERVLEVLRALEVEAVHGVALTGGA